MDSSLLTVVPPGPRGTGAVSPLPLPAPELLEPAPRPAPALGPRSEVGVEGRPQVPRDAPHGPDLGPRVPARLPHPAPHLILIEGHPAGLGGPLPGPLGPRVPAPGHTPSSTSGSHFSPAHSSPQASRFTTRA